MTKKVVYLGDTSLPGPASYLAGIMINNNIPFEYIPADKEAGEDALSNDVGLYILSDYPSANFKDKTLDRICDKINEDASLIMFGGWESYHGLGGDYDLTPIKELLPVNISSTDDRRNWSQLAMVRKEKDHPILEGLPFDSPPGIGGYNEFTLKQNAELLLSGELYKIDATGKSPELSLEGNFPLLAVSEEKTLRAALATDVAPHWVGGFVDWGEPRVKVKMGKDFIEVGCYYERFFANLLKWALRKIN